MFEKERKRTLVVRFFLVEMCRIQRKNGKVFLILHVYSDLIRKVINCLIPLPPHVRKKSEIV